MGFYKYWEASHVGMSQRDQLWSQGKTWGAATGEEGIPSPGGVKSWGHRMWKGMEELSQECLKGPAQLLPLAGETTPAPTPLSVPFAQAWIPPQPDVLTEPFPPFSQTQAPGNQSKRKNRLKQSSAKQEAIFQGKGTLRDNSATSTPRDFH